MDIRNLHENWGIEIRLKSSTDFFAQPKGFWRKLLYEKKLLLFKKMDFTKEQYIQFGSYFGQLWNVEHYSYTWEEVEQVGKHAFSRFSNKTSEFTATHPLPWHADIPIYDGHMYPMRSLWAQNVPNSEKSGITGFLKIDSEAIQLLSPDVKAILEDTRVQFQKWHRPGTDVQEKSIIKSHPVTKEKSLQINYYNTDTIKNAWITDVLIKNESQNSCHFVKLLIDQLLQFPQLQYYHIWDQQDLLIYDNYSFLHNRTPLKLSADQERLFYRLNIDHVLDENL